MIEKWEEWRKIKTSDGKEYLIYIDAVFDYDDHYGYAEIDVFKETRNIGGIIVSNGYIDTWYLYEDIRNALQHFLCEDIEFTEYKETVRDEVIH